MGFPLEQPSHRTQEPSLKLVKSAAQFSGYPQRQALQGWKAIGAALDRGIRTVQRWERTLGLPVHRLGEGPSCPVFAFQDELQLWLREKATNHAQRDNGQASTAQHRPATISTQPKRLRSVKVNGRQERAPEPEIIRSLNAFFAVKGSTHKESTCESCSSSTRLLVGQFWLYGTEKTWQVSIPFCPQCDSDVRALLPPSSDRVS